MSIEIIDDRAGTGVSPPPLPVTVVRRAVPRVEALDAYRALVERYGADGVYLTEALAGPTADKRAAMVGFDPLLSLVLRGTEMAVSGVAGLAARALAAAATVPGVVVLGDRLTLPEDGRLWDVLRAIQGVFSVAGDPDAKGFRFGFFGYLGYDTVRFVERLPLSIARRDDVPDIHLVVHRGCLRIDNASGISELRIADLPGLPILDLAAIEALIANPPPLPGLPAAVPAPQSVRRSIARDRFCADVETALGYVGIGDIYQVQIGQELAIASDLTPETVYRRLRYRNPAPCMVLASLDGVTLVGASPEVFVTLQDGAITMRPLAGTVRRGATEAESAAAAARLRGDAKEVAEHVMLVDLCRNDIGRICEPGSLAVTELLATEPYSHVIHLVSNVVGRLDRSSDVYDTISACFPAGTMTGAPKVRAMEIIEELETLRRGPYAGAFGLIDFGGEADLALCIRTAVHTGGEYLIRASAGIVADSVPQSEWNETVAKLGATYWAITGEELVP